MSSVEKKQKGLTRRDFVKGAAIGAVGGLVAGTAGTALAAPKAKLKPWLPAKWDKEADVVVVGYGGAGAVAAITAHDLGSKVLILEKAPKGREGGNTRASANLYFNPTNAADAITYLNAMSDGYPVPQDMVRVWADKMVDNDNWVKKMGGKVNLLTIFGSEYPQLPGSKSFEGFHYIGPTWGRQHLWILMNENVMKRGIEVWFDSPATKLIQNPETKEILGIVVNKRGVSTTIKAKKAVLMTLGGFENNQQMVQDYLHLPNCYPKGTPYNTGDGHKMCMEIGADFWHMANLAGPDFNVRVPEFEAAFGYTPGAQTRSFILVGADGTRYWDESISRKHGKIAFHGIYIPDFMPLPLHGLFDEKARLAGPLYTMVNFGWNFEVEGYKWSKDNSAEVAKGWIVKADTIRDLAAKIKKDPDALEKTVNRYNGFCAAGEDADFGRPKKYLLPLETPPFYAVDLVPTFTNTQGGPRRNKLAQILDTQGKPIARLYSAGEFGSIYSHCYQGGGNVGECIAFGRIAGDNAAAEKPWK